MQTQEFVGPDSYLTLYQCKSGMILLSEWSYSGLKPKYVRSESDLVCAKPQVSGCKFYFCMQIWQVTKITLAAGSLNTFESLGPASQFVHLNVVPWAKKIRCDEFRALF